MSNAQHRPDLAEAHVMVKALSQFPTGQGALYAKLLDICPAGKA